MTTIKKLPVGTTMHYIDCLKNKQYQILQEIRENWAFLLIPDVQYKAFIEALVNFAGTLQYSFLQLWMRPKLPQSSIVAFGLLNELLLTDSVFYKKFVLFQPKLAALHLDHHLVDGNDQEALEVIKLLSAHHAYSDYTKYVVTARAREYVTADLSRRIKSKKRKAGTALDGLAMGGPDGRHAKKIKYETNVDDSVPGRWYWADNGDVWVGYDNRENDKVESAFVKGQKTVKLDATRYIDFTHMWQRRYDDPSKKRPIKREQAA